MIDLHSHFLPGVDDGAENINESIDAIKWLVRQGMTDIVATPHYIYETDYNSPINANYKLLEELKNRLDAEGIDVNLYLGNEIFYTENIEELIKAGELTSLAGSRYLLIELSLNEETMRCEWYFRELIDKGYKVVLAHPERYALFQEDYDALLVLYDMGVLFQSNIRSFIGKYGPGAEHLVKKMAKKKMIYLLASDTHRAGPRNSLTEGLKKASRYYNERELALLTTTNPQLILDDGKK